MCFRLRCYPEGKFELPTNSLDGLLHILARVTALTDVGVDEGDAAVTFVYSGSSGTGS